MTFQEYLDQKDPKRRHSVDIADEDIFHRYSGASKGEFIVLNIHGDFYTYYREEGKTLLWTVDEDGNKKSTSCFRYIENN